MVSRLARTLLVTGIAVARCASGPERERIIRGTRMRGGSAPATNMDCHPSQGTRNNSQQRTEDCTDVVPGHECCGGATAPALARTTISAPLLMDPRRVALSRPRKTSSPRRRPRATEMDEERQPAHR